jgi:hypothetical protein
MYESKREKNVCIKEREKCAKEREKKVHIQKKGRDKESASPVQERTRAPF